MATYLDLVTDALLELGVIGEVETPSSAQSLHAKRVLNRMLDQWKVDRLQMFVIIRDTATLTPNTEFFNVGDGAAHIDIPRPAFLEKVNYQDTTTDIEYSLGPLLTEQEFENIPQKTMTSTVPSRAYYGTRYPFARLRPWPIPTSTTLEWVLYYRQQIETVTDLTTDVELPPGYEELIVTNLAVRLAPSYEKEPSPLLVQRSNRAVELVKRANIRYREIEFEAAALISPRPYYDIRIE